MGKFTMRFATAGQAKAFASVCKLAVGVAIETKDLARDGKSALPYPVLCEGSDNGRIYAQGVTDAIRFADDRRGA